MKNILVTGSNGMLGQKLVYKLAARKDVRLIATSKGNNRLKKQDGYIYVPLDISDRSLVEEVFREYRPDCVINTAAMTNVDACETKQDECRAANITAVKNICGALEQVNPAAHLIHISTDFVFDGLKGSEYNEDDVPNPQSYYAWSKLEGEKIVQQSLLKWAILRTIIVYAVSDDSNRSNLVLWVKNNLEQKKKINVISDQYRAPTLSEDLADACISCADKNAEGIFHVSGEQTHSILELAYRIADFWKLDRSYITPVTSEQLNQPAKRPPYTGFIIDKAKKVLGYKPHTFAEGLKIVDEQLKGKI